MDTISADSLCVFDGDVVKRSTEIFIRFEYLAIDKAAVLLLGPPPPSPAISSHSSSSTSGSGDLKVSFLRLGESIEREQVFCEGIDARIGASSSLVEFFDEICGTYSRIPNQLTLERLLVQKGLNRMVCRYFVDEKYLEVEFSMWGYDIRDLLVVMDVDGTVTRSDVRGYVESVYLGMYGFTHSNLSSFLHFLEVNLGLHVIFLTSRPLCHLKDTKRLLHNLWNSAEDPMLLNRGGPVFANKESLLRAAYRELVSRRTVPFKLGVLLDIVQVFATGNDHKDNCRNPLFAALGNKVADARAYIHAGISPSHILLINPSSKLRVFEESKLSLAGNSSQLNTTAVESEDCSDDAVEVVLDTSSKNKNSLYFSSLIPSFLRMDLGRSFSTSTLDAPSEKNCSSTLEITDSSNCTIITSDGIEYDERLETVSVPNSEIETENKEIEMKKVFAGYGDPYLHEYFRYLRAEVTSTEFSV